MKPKREKSVMLPRQWRLYEFLKAQTTYLSREEIMQQSGLYEKENIRTLTSDLQAIKENPTIVKILITSRNGIKIAETKEEADAYLEREKAEVLRRLQRYYNQAKQYGLDNQSQIVWNSEKEILEVFTKWNILYVV